MSEPDVKRIGEVDHVSATFASRKPGKGSGLGASLAHKGEPALGGKSSVFPVSLRLEEEKKRLTSERPFFKV